MGRFWWRLVNGELLGCFYRLYELLGGLRQAGPALAIEVVDGCDGVAKGDQNVFEEMVVDMKADMPFFLARAIEMEMYTVFIGCYVEATFAAKRAHIEFVGKVD